MLFFTEYHKQLNLLLDDFTASIFEHLDNNACLLKPCKNGRPCTDMTDGAVDHGYECDCGSDYRGVDCETQINHCAENPCGVDFTCLNGEGKFICKPDGIVSISDVAETFQNGWVPVQGTWCRKLYIDDNISTTKIKSHWWMDTLDWKYVVTWVSELQVDMRINLPLIM